MLRIHFLRQWYSLSDPSMEEALYDTAVMRLSAGINSLERIPDETTILNFRRLLEPHGLGNKMLEAVVSITSKRAAAIQIRSCAGSASALFSQRSSVASETPTSSATALRRQPPGYRLVLEMLSVSSHFIPSLSPLQWILSGRQLFRRRRPKSSLPPKV